MACEFESHKGLGMKSLAKWTVLAYSCTDSAKAKTNKQTNKSLLLLFLSLKRFVITKHNCIKKKASKVGHMAHKGRKKYISPIWIPLMFSCQSEQSAHHDIKELLSSSATVASHPQEHFLFHTLPLSPGGLCLGLLNVLVTTGSMNIVINSFFLCFGY